ncbi:MAG: hypothetical protein AAGE99_00005 [Chlamydiota bacterium]
MSTAIEADQTSNGAIEESPVHWGKNLPEELWEEASSVSNLAFDLFQKLNVHPNVYVPCKDPLSVKNGCRFSWTNNRGQFGSIDLGKCISLGDNKEYPQILLRIGNQKNISTSPVVTDVTFKEGTGITTMPVELRREAENLIKVAAGFFRKLVRHPTVITRDGGDNLIFWDYFYRYKVSEGKTEWYSNIRYSDKLNEWSEDRVQSLYFQIAGALSQRILTTTSDKSSN